MFSITEMAQRKYEIELTEGSSDTYEIKGMDFFIKFKYYYGYANYVDDEILEIGSSAWASTFYNKE